MDFNYSACLVENYILNTDFGEVVIKVQIVSNEMECTM